MPKGQHLAYADVEERLTRAAKRFIEVWAEDDLSIELFQPRGPDTQKPHDRDEIYVVMKGEGGFCCEGETRAFREGDVLVVPAWAEHRFVDFSDDLSLWVFFVGAAKPEKPGGS